MDIRAELMFIGGEWVRSSDGATLDVSNPATGETVATVPVATEEDLDHALSCVESGSAVWRSMSAWERSAILRKASVLLTERIDHIATVLTTEQGKPLKEARGEVGAAAEQFDWFADEARRIYGRTVDSRLSNHRFQVLREPIGPVAAFTPWNFPILLAARKVAPALAAGCSVVLKPAEEAPTAALEMARALSDAGLPPGVLNVVTGDPAEISKRLLASPIIRKVSLTGSTRVGQQLLELAAHNINHVSMELGGHAPVIVFADADPAETARSCVSAKFRNAGQVCVAPTRFFVHEDIAEDFIAAFIEESEKLRLGPGLEAETEVGPLSSERRLVAVESLVENAIGLSATVATGGSRNAEMRGYFFPPTVLLDVPETAEVLTTEPFGPLATITRFSNIDDVLVKANSTPFGLAGYAFTNNLSTAIRVSEGLDVGIVGINTFAVSGAQVPFSGVKMSGIGAESGTEGIEAYLHSKTVAMGLRHSD